MKTHKGFTLMEVLVGVIAVGLISLAGWVTATVLLKSAELARNRSEAVNLLQKSQEEVRRVAQVLFAGLEDCEFPSPDSDDTTDTCGFADIVEEFPKFTRSLEVSREEDNVDLKRVLITVNWTELGNPQTLQSVVLLAKPPDPLPGNIIGIVRPLGEANELIANANITVSLADSTESRTTQSADELDAKGANFDFADRDTGRFVLPAGSWQLTASHSSYRPYTHPTPIILESNQEIFVDLALEPNPEDARITGDVIDQTTGLPVSTFSRANINLYDGTSRIRRINNQRSYSFTIEFSDTDEQCFTVNTNNAFKAGYAYPVNAGGAPSCLFAYNREGWSSSVVQEDASLVCSNPYNGSSALDRICVEPGDTEELDIPVEPVPEVVITGRAIDGNGNPINDATIRARWPRSDSADWRKNGSIQTATTGGDGRFTFSVPAVQGMFPDGNPSQNYLRVWARARVPILSCCNDVRLENRSSPTKNVGPLFPGDPVRDIGDLVISVEDRDCGNVQGTVIEGKFGNPLSSVSVRITGSPETTDGSGEYIFDCPDEGFRLPRGGYDFEASRSGYYDYDSDGNSQYARGPSVQVRTNEVTTYDGRLWPEGFGIIEVTVVDASTDNPVPQANVRLRTYAGTTRNETTNAQGLVVFDPVAETWPPPSLPNDPFYNQNSKRHSVRVTHDSGIYLSVEQTTPELVDGQTLQITIALPTQGNM